MPRKQLRTPRSQVRSALRQLFLRSRERQAAIKRDKYTCVKCGKKQSKAKGKEVAIEVHHVNGVAWEHLLNEVYLNLLVDPKEMVVLCKECHKQVD